MRQTSPESGGRRPELSDERLRHYAKRFETREEAVEQFLERSWQPNDMRVSFCSGSDHRLLPSIYKHDDLDAGGDITYCSEPACFLDNIDISAVNPSAGEKKRPADSWYRSESEKISHTQHAETLLKKRRFATMRDTEEVYRYTGGVYMPGGEPLIKAEAQSMIGDGCSHGDRLEVLNTVRVLTYVDRGDFDAERAKLCVRNGIVDILTGRLEPHDPDRLFRVQLPVDYDPTAAPRRFMRFLFEVIDDRMERQTVLEFFASALLKHELNLDKALILFGTGANGKSTLLKAVTELFGSEQVANVSLHDLISEKFMRSFLEHKMLNVYADISFEELKNLSVIKNIISGDPLTVEKKNLPPFSIKPYAKMVFSCNNLPTLDESTDAIFRRFRVIRFTRQFSPSQRDILSDFEDETEKSGMLNLLMGHARVVYANRRLTYDVPIAQMREEWEVGANHVRRFFKAMLVKEPGARAPKSAVYAAYVKFCKKINYVPVISARLTKDLKRSIALQEGFAKVNGRSVRVWYEVRLKDDDDAAKPAEGGVGGPRAAGRIGGSAAPSEGAAGGKMASDTEAKESADADGGKDTAGGGGTYWRCPQCNSAPWPDDGSAETLREKRFHSVPGSGCSVIYCDERGKELD